jgi:D-alanyl-D-alanine carboxypeptidase
MCHVLRFASILNSLVLILALVLPAAAPARAQETPPALVAAFDSVLEAARISLDAPGALLFVAGPGIGAYQTASGVAEQATGTSLGPVGRVRIASLTKLFVAVVALQLVQEGWLSLDQSVEHWLPGLVPGGDQITVRQLLQHTSGLPDYLSDGMVARARRDPGHVWSPQELVAEALRRAPRFPAGAPQRWIYANTNYIVLGLIVERVTGNALDLELRQRIIGPLGLRNTALAPPTADPGDLARGYVRGADYTEINMSVAWAAGGMTSTVFDLGVFLRALLGGALLRPEMLAAMQQWHLTGGTGDAPDLAYGLGLMRRTLPDAAGLAPAARLAIGHTGALGGYRIAAWHLPASDITIVAALTTFEAQPNVVVVRTLETLVTQGVLRAP